MRHLRSRASLGALLSAAALFAGSAVKADIIPVFNAATPLGGGITEFSYNANVSTGSKVNTGDYFTIYDFHGYVAGSAFAPADWSISEQLVGVTPAGQLITEDAAVVNFTFTYTGAAEIVGPALIGGPGAFGANSTMSSTTPFGRYTSETHKNNPGEQDHNTLQSNQGFLVTPSVIPETSSLMLLVPGLVPLGIMLRRRARK